MNMFKDIKPVNVKEYLAAVPPERKEVVDTIHKFIQKSAPELKVFFAYNMIGYGKFKYVNYKKEKVDWPVIALANQKNYVSIYVCALDGDEYIAEKYKDDLGKVNVGKSCIRFKKLEDLNMKTLERVIKQASNKPGLKS